MLYLIKNKGFVIKREKIISIAHDVFALEAEEILGLSKHLTEDFTKAVESILEANGKVIVCGIGKSGIIGKKIAATFASTGTPSFFLHPAEAYHGDLGMVGSEDIVILISNSGESDEILKLIPFFKNQNNTLIAISGNASSTLAKNSDFFLNIAVTQEACPLQLAPTSSTTATLVMGDALAVALMQCRGFQEHHFAQFHPGGSLGRRLLVKAGDIAKKANLPKATQEEAIIEVVHTISKCGFGLCVIMNNEQIAGVITDGDIRRAMEEMQERFFALQAKDLMSKNPKILESSASLHQAQQMMEEHKINALLVIDDGKLMGIIQIYDMNI